MSRQKLSPQGVIDLVNAQCAETTNESGKYGRQNHSQEYCRGARDLARRITDRIAPPRDKVPRRQTRRGRGSRRYQGTVGESQPWLFHSQPRES